MDGWPFRRPHTISSLDSVGFSIWAYHAFSYFYETWLFLDLAQRLFQICFPTKLCGGAILRYFSILRQRRRLIFMENVRMSIQLLFAFVISHLASPIFIFDMKVIIFVGHSKHRSLVTTSCTRGNIMISPFEMSNATTNPLSTFVN